MANEKRLIDANALMEEAHWVIRSDGTRVFAIHAEDVDNAPTVDAVEVVRCKDCKYWLNSWVAPGAEHAHGYCHIEESDDVVVGRWDDDFCSYGERKDNA